jgi:competence protein ComEA
VDRTLAAAGVVTALIVGLGVVSWPRAPAPVPIELTPAAAARSLTVHVSGAVANPGLVHLAGGSRVADAIAAAGGAVESADLGALNLAASVGDGARVVVPDATANGPSGTMGDGLVRVNAASPDELERLPGVGPVLAERIASVRDQRGAFETIEDLLDVPGIGEAKLAAMRDAVIIP